MEAPRKDYLILGAGIAGLGAAQAVRQHGDRAVILERDATYGGLCGNFTIQGFRFDRFVHFSFTGNERVNALFRAASPEIIAHEPEAWNLYRGKWIRHPAQNNLFPLDEWEKERIIADSSPAIPASRQTSTTRAAAPFPCPGRTAPRSAE